jgi:hypothetical protein
MILSAFIVWLWFWGALLWAAHLEIQADVATPLWLNLALGALWPVTMPIGVGLVIMRWYIERRARA